jgi:hypothetical protein
MAVMTPDTTTALTPMLPDPRRPIAGIACSDTNRTTPLQGPISVMTAYVIRACNQGSRQERRPFGRLSESRHCLPMWKRSDRELLQVADPRCPQCQTRMITTAVEEGPEGFERRSFQCSSCGHCEQNVIACDPTDANAVGWIDSKSQPPKQGFRQDGLHSLETTSKLPSDLRGPARPRSGDRR